MMSKIFVYSLLIEEPKQWGLRGDPYLWNELIETTHNTLVPETKAELTLLLKRLIKDIIGEELTPAKNITVLRFPNSGMSGGIISSDYWLDVLIPLIINRSFK